MIPSAPTRDTKSDAERRLFEKFKHLPGFDDWTCLHSLRLSRSDYAVCGEIDFLLIGPPGVFVCEVKGGAVSYDGRSWRHENRYGKVSFKDRGPMKQAEQAMFSLKSSLEGLGRSGLADGVLFGWFVVFPDIDFEVRSSEWDGAEVLDQTSVTTLEDLARELHAMVGFWREALRGNAREKPLLTPSRVEELTTHWRPMFDRSPSLRNMVVSAIDSSDSFTEEQYRVVSLIDRNPRLVCEGGAGTGKSFIALEVARRRRDTGMSVLFTAKNPNLLAFLRAQRDTEGIDFIPYDECLNLGRKWDFLVIDEAQDVITAGNALNLDRFADSLGAEGQWLICVDPATQTGFYGDFDPVQYAEIVLISGHITLHENCRNTGNIVTQMGLVLGQSFDASVLDAGPPVWWTPPLEDARSEAQALEKFLRGMLMKQGFQQHDVTILELNPDHGVLGHLPKPLSRMIQRVSPESVLEWPFRGIGLAGVSDFKGLESNVICLIGARGLGAIEEVRNLLYVAMSRARALLWIANTPEFDSAVKELMEPCG